MAKTQLPILDQRRIEANIIKPIYDEMVKRLGQPEAAAILSAAITKDSVAQGRAYAASEDGAPTLETFHHLLPQWTANGALDIDLL